MEKGVVSKSMAALRREPTHTSEMVNQLLFGETFDMVERQGGWLKVKGHTDGYSGWMDERLSLQLPDNSPIFTDKPKIASRLFRAKAASGFTTYLCPGSQLHSFDGKTFRNGSSSFVCMDTPFAKLPDNPRKKILALSTTFMDAPYLWGGRSLFGVDCSGLVQVVFEIAGTMLPRDACDQAGIGQTIEFANEAKPGDLAFFDDENGVITHVGIVAENATIIHCSGFVRVDRFDHQGIFNLEAHRYTHKLRIIRRVIFD